MQILTISFIFLINTPEIATPVIIERQKYYHPKVFEVPLINRLIYLDNVKFQQMACAALAIEFSKSDTDLMTKLDFYNPEGHKVRLRMREGGRSEYRKLRTRLDMIGQPHSALCERMAKIEPNVRPAGCRSTTRLVEFQFEGENYEVKYDQMNKAVADKSECLMFLYRINGDEVHFLMDKDSYNSLHPKRESIFVLNITQCSTLEPTA